MASFTDRMLGAAKLDVATYEEVEADQTALGQAMAVVVLSSLAAGIGAYESGIMVVIVSIFGALVGWFIWAGLTYLIGTKILPEPTTKSDIGELLRTIGFASTPGLLRVFAFVPVVGMLISLVASIWMLVAMIVAVRQALDYTSTGRAVGVVVIGFVVYMVVVMGIMMVVGIVGVAADAAMN